MNFNKELHKYILSHIDNEDQILQELDRETNLKVLRARMISGHLQGQVLSMLSKMVRPKNILEIGTFTGYSAICLVKGLQKDGKLITLEIDDELELFAQKYFKKAGIQEKIEQKIGSALEIIPTLNETFDLVFIDADKREYCEYFKMIYPKIRAGGFIIADNTLWSGKVLEDPNCTDEQTLGVIRFNELIRRDSRVEKIILPLRDGMTVIRKK